MPMVNNVNNAVDVNDFYNLDNLMTLGVSDAPYTVDGVAGTFATFADAYNAALNAGVTMGCVSGTYSPLYVFG